MPVGSMSRPDLYPRTAPGDSQQPGSGWRGLGEHHHPVVLRVDGGLPDAVALSGADHLVDGAGNGVDVHADHTHPSQLVERVQHP